MKGKKSLAYWIARAQANDKIVLRAAENASREIRAMYRQQYNRVNAKLRVIAIAAENGHMTRSQAWDFLRLQGVEAELQTMVDVSFRFQNDEIYKVIEKAFRTVIGKDAAEFAGTGMQQQLNIENVINLDWSGARYSERVWKNTNALAQRVRGQMLDMMVQGQNYETMRRQVLDEFAVTWKQADRLVRTESSYVMNEAAKVRYKSMGARRVEWLAGSQDGHLCDTCEGYHGQRFTIENAPPLPAHPNCRCTWIPVLEDLGIGKD